jgi:LAO/AO transport system kinase
MSEWYTHPHVFIRSLASRGSMGGLHPRIIEITELVKAAHFDYIILETVGVGQSEIEIAGLADVTVVVLVPESGDEIQTMKAGLMEIADVFVINKSDRPGADLFVKNLRLMLAPAFAKHKNEVPVIKTIASEKKGLYKIKEAVEQRLTEKSFNEKKLALLADKAYLLIQHQRMKDISKEAIKAAIVQTEEGSRNLYQIVRQFK